MLPGGSGHLGTALARYLHQRGHTVVVLTRRAVRTPWRVVAWDGKAIGDWCRELEGTDAVVNLAGRSVNCRYNEAHRREILESRIAPTLLIGRAIQESRTPPRIWMNASTATIYRHSLDRAMDESTGEIGGSEPGVPRSWGFSVEVAKRWEEALFAGQTPRTRRIALRTAMVMMPDRGSIFDVLMGLARCGLGGRMGSGRQFISWIHEMDFVRAVEHLLTRGDFDGVMNLSSPAPLENREFMRALRGACGVRLGLPASRWMLEIGTWLLRSEPELVLKSRRVFPKRLLESGFRFGFADWQEAARDLVARRRGERLENPEPSRDRRGMTVSQTGIEQLEIRRKER